MRPDYIYVSAGASLRLGKTIKRQNAHPRGVDSSTMALVSAFFLILVKIKLKQMRTAHFLIFMLTDADVCLRMQTYAGVCWRMLTYADVWS